MRVEKTLIPAGDCCWRACAGFDGQRYCLGDFVVMPNHVHLLVCLLNATDIELQPLFHGKNILQRELIKAIGQSGRFWHEESFDHLVRTPVQFANLQRYIYENPHAAGLSVGNYLYSGL